MKFKLIWLILFFFIYEFINEPLKWLIVNGQMGDLLEWTRTKKHFLWFISGNVSMFLYALIAYAGLFYYFPQRKWAQCLGVIITAFIVPMLVRYIWEEVIYYEIFGFRNYFEGTSYFQYLRDNFYYAFRYVTFGLVFYLIRYAIFNEGQKNKLAIENKRMELDMLRSQINPHFLLNAMNNIYSLVYQKSDKSLDAIDTLSGVLKYTLYEQEEMVALEEELKNVDKIIEINKLRFAYDLPIIKTIDEGLLKVNIPPFLILPLIENAFKHGDFKDSEKPLMISVQSSSSEIEIYISNKKGDFYKDKVGGIGLENIRKRLELIYPKNHSFATETGENMFNVRINIPKG